MHSTIITKFTTTQANQNILGLSAIESKIVETMGITEADYARMLQNKSFKLDFTIFFNGPNKVSVNNNSFNDIIEDAVYTSGGPVHISSIRVEAITTATIMFTIN